MSKSFVIIATLLCCAASGSIAQPLFSAPSPGLQGQVPKAVAPAPGLSNTGPVREDFTGKLYRYVDDAGNVVMGPVKANGYGYGVHQDQYGRAVHAVPLDGKAGTVLQPR